MAEFHCVERTSSSLKFEVSSLQVVQYRRRFKFSCGGFTKSTNLAAGSTQSSVSKEFTGLQSNRTYSCHLDVYNRDTGDRVAQFDASGTTLSPGAEFVCTGATATSLTFSARRLSTVDYQRVFTMTCNGVTYSKTIAASATPGTISHTFAGLSPNTSYECTIDAIRTDTGASIWTDSAEGTTDPLLFGNTLIFDGDDWIPARGMIYDGTLWVPLSPLIQEE